MLRVVALSDDLRRVAERAAAFADTDEHVQAVLAAEPSPGLRFYLCAFASDSEPQARTWLVLDDGGSPVTSRALVREATSIAALAEVAADTAGGGELEELRRQLVQLRMTERPPGIDEAEDAALELERMIGTAPRVATPGFLDDVGAATRRLELALGDDASPFSRAMASSMSAVDALTSEVEARYKRELT